MNEIIVIPKRLSKCIKLNIFPKKKIIKNIYVPTGIHYLSFSDPLPKTPLFSMDLSKGIVSSLNVVNQVRTAFVKKKSLGADKQC